MAIAESTYGSDDAGLIWGYRFERGTPPVAITAGEAVRWLETPGPGTGDSFIWLHFSLSNSATTTWLRRHLALPEAFYNSFGEHAGSTRVEQDGDALVAVVHDALFEFTIDPESISTVDLCMTSRFLVTVRLRPVRSVDRLRGAVRACQVFGSPADLLAQLLRHQADVVTDILRQSTTQVDAIEDKLLANRIASSRRDLGALRRTLVRLQRLLAPEPAALFRLLSRPPSWIDAGALQELRQAAEEFSAAIADSGAIGERVKLLQEEMAALVGEQTNRTLFVLTVVTVLALPVNLVAGLFGMNVGGIPLASHRQGFLLVVGALFVFTAVAAYVAFARRHD